MQDLSPAWLAVMSNYSCCEHGDVWAGPPQSRNHFGGLLLVQASAAHEVGRGGSHFGGASLGNPIGQGWSSEECLGKVYDVSKVDREWQKL